MAKVKLSQPAVIEHFTVAYKGTDAGELDSLDDALRKSTQYVWEQTCALAGVLNDLEDRVKTLKETVMALRAVYDYMRGLTSDEKGQSK